MKTSKLHPTVDMMLVYLVCTMLCLVGSKVECINVKISVYFSSKKKRLLGSKGRA